MLNDNLGFIDALKDLLDEYQVTLKVNDNYDGQDQYCGTSVEFISETSTNGCMDVFIDDMEELKERLNHD